MRIVRYETAGSFAYGVQEQGGVRPAGRDLTALSPTGDLLNLDEVKLAAPVPRPGKIIGVGLNYRDHAIETNTPIPEKPILFAKFSTAVTDPLAPIVIPADSGFVDYEAELGVVIGRRARHVRESQAFDYVLGYTCLNDVSAREFQVADGQWTRAKSFDTFCPLGPSIVTPDEITDPQRLSIECRVNGATVQKSNTKEMIFSVAYLIEYISRTITLEPGDIIATGTPPGVGQAKKPPRGLEPGDVVEIEIEGIGILRNPVLDEVGA